MIPLLTRSFSYDASGVRDQTSLHTLLLNLTEVCLHTSSIRYASDPQSSIQKHLSRVTVGAAASSPIERPIPAAQMEVLDDEQNVQASTQSIAFVFGALRFQLTVLSISMVITGIYLTECVRTKLWTHATTLNFMNVKSTVVATSAGGTAIAKRANHEALHARNDSTPSQCGDFKVVARDADSGHEFLVVRLEEYHLVSRSSHVVGSSLLKLKGRLSRKRRETCNCGSLRVGDCQYEVDPSPH